MNDIKLSLQKNYVMLTYRTHLETRNFKLDLKLCISVNAEIKRKTEQRVSKTILKHWGAVSVVREGVGNSCK